MCDENAFTVLCNESDIEIKSSLSPVNEKKLNYFEGSKTLSLMYSDPNSITQELNPIGGGHESPIGIAQRRSGSSHKTLEITPLAVDRSQLISSAEEFKLIY